LAITCKVIEPAGFYLEIAGNPTLLPKAPIMTLTPARLTPLLLAALGVALTAGAWPAGAQPDAKAPLARPADVETWVTLGTTIRATAADPATPNQFRHIQIGPGAWRALKASGRLPDGAVLAATFYSARREAETPTLYAGDKEVFFSLEVLDKAHPDGRRFYNFPPGATSATALPPGNACAACHNAKGALQGTFAQDYPLAAKFAPPHPGG
jgi:hypothetical protein